MVSAASSAWSPGALAISPTPTDEEVVAIVAAIELAWPRAVIVAAAPAREVSTTAWKWSGRWWVGRKHVAADRRRP